jgi:hypothetical protein
MATFLRSIWLLPLLTLAGCLPNRDEPLQTVKLGESVRPPSGYKDPRPPLSPATEAEAKRVVGVGEKVLQSNRLIGLHPQILPVGVPAVEVFHKGTEVLYITEGMSRKCTTEGQLAAVLAFEMGRMVAEREALAAPEARRPERLPPPDSHVGTDSGGPFGSPDGTHLAELAKFEKEHPRRPAAPPRIPDAMALAKHYLETAGYSAKELDDVAPLLKEARRQDGFERQLVGNQFDRPWTP